MGCSYAVDSLDFLLALAVPCNQPRSCVFPCVYTWDNCGLQRTVHMCSVRDVVGR
jgi:hypothetical protein